MHDINTNYCLDDIRKANAILDMQEDIQRERDRKNKQKGNKR